MTLVSLVHAALVWVALSLFGAAAFVGEGGGAEKVDQTASQVARAIIERRLMLDRDPRDDPGGVHHGRRSGR